MKHLYAPLLVAVLAAAPSRAAAQPPDQTPPDAPPRFAADVVVTPERGDTPRALAPASTVLDRGALAEVPVVHPSELVSLLPGFDVARPEFYAGKPVVSARGFFGGGEADYVLLLVDGVRVSDVESGLADWSIVRMASVERVEASRGPGASLYGDAAIGGVIQIFTGAAPGRGEATVTGGSFGTFTMDALYGRRAGRAGFTVSGAARRTGGAFDHSAADQVVGGGTADGTAGDFTWRWTGSADTRNRDDPGALSVDTLRLSPRASDPMFRFDTADRHGFSTAFTLRQAAASWKPLARVYVSNRDENVIRTLPLIPGVGDRRARALSSLAAGGSLEAEHAFASARPVVVRLGAEIARERLDTQYRDVNAGGVVGALDSEAAGRRVRAGAFAFASWEPASRLRLSGAMRWDDVDDRGFGATTSPQRAWSPRAALSLQLTESGSIAAFASASRAFKAPTLDQLFDPRPIPDFRGGTITISNPALVPQRASDAEVGLSGGDRRVRWSALAYRMTVDDELDFDVRTFRYANIGRGRHTGVELEGEGRWWTRVRPSIAYTLARVVDLPDEAQLKNVPRHVASAGVSIDFPFAIGVSARYARAWGAFLDDADRYAIDGRSTLDLRVRRPVRRYTIFADVLNATNRIFEEYGFTLSDFRGRVVPYAYPGAPRAARVGVTAAF